MTAEEKAKELIERFKKHSHFDWNEFDGFNKESGERNAKQCALICVDEMLKVVPAMRGDNIQIENYWRDGKIIH